MAGTNAWWACQYYCLLVSYTCACLAQLTAVYFRVLQDRIQIFEVLFPCGLILFPVICLALLRHIAVEGVINGNVQQAQPVVVAGLNGNEQQNRLINVAP